MDTEASNNNSPQNQEDENRPLIGEVDFTFEVTVACGPVKWSIETHASDLRAGPNEMTKSSQRVDPMAF